MHFWWNLEAGCDLEDLIIQGFDFYHSEEIESEENRSHLQP